jgi:hypothetical protein
MFSISAGGACPSLRNFRIDIADSTCDTVLGFIDLEPILGARSMPYGFYPSEEPCFLKPASKDPLTGLDSQY